MEFCREWDFVLPASWKQRANKNMVTFRSPGAQGLPGNNPDPAKYAELDVVVMPRRWDSAL
eukprot:559388-Alexandrium_andersonii.AAC.1